MFNLKGKIAVVTGASSGLGRDAALAYAKEGANIGLLARRLDKIENLANEIRSFGVKAIPVQCNVTKEEEVKNAIQKIFGEFGRIDILLNNAGITSRGGVDNLTEEEWDKCMDTNVKGTYLVSKYIIPIMQAQNYGKVVNISSVNAFLAEKDDMLKRHVYNASKAAILGLSRGMAASYAKYGITVNTICPGLFQSEMTERTLFKSEEFLEKYNSRCPAARSAKSGELNGTIFYFSSDASSYVTGQYIVVDGGISIV